MASFTEQAIFNIAFVGHVAHGKSSCVRACTDIVTQQDSREKVKNITINLGYANMKIWRDPSGKLYTSGSQLLSYQNPSGEECELVNHISCSDCPGHQSLIQTMLSAVSTVDGAIVIVAVNEPLSSSPQLIQHLAAAKLAKIRKIIVCMNKIDLVTKDVVMQRKQELDELLSQYDIVPHVVIPTCFNKKIGIDRLATAIMELFNPSEYIKNLCDSDPLFSISRTFDVNKPGTPWDQVIGGVFGGSLQSGTIRKGDVLEIRPGLVMKNKEGNFECTPFQTKVLSIESQKIALDSLIPRGLASISTDIDPNHFKGNGQTKGGKKDSLIGHVVGTPGKMPSVFIEVCFELDLVTTFGFSWKPVLKDLIVIQIGTRVCDAQVKEIKKSTIKVELAKPCCISDNEHIIICKIIDKILRIVGEGVIRYSDNPMKLIE
jgi:translation initiation factor 2 subunit 3